MSICSHKRILLNRSVAFALCVLLAASFGLCAAAAGSESASQRAVRVGMFTGEGYAELDAAGNWSGIDIEITENIAQTAGFEVSFVEVSSVQQAFSDLENGKLDMVADISKNEEREQKYLFSQYEQGSVGTNIFVREDDDRWDYENVDQLKKMTFSCERGNIAESDFLQWCSQYGFEPNIVLYDSSKEAADAVSSGNADGYVDGEDFLKGFRSILSFAPSPYYYVFAQGSTALKRQVDAALAQIYIHDPLYGKELQEKYIGVTQSSTATFSRDEKAYIASNPNVRIAVLKGDEPYFSGTAQSPKGIIPEFYKQISAVTGLTFTYQIYETQAQAIEAVESGQADIVGMYSDGMTKAYEQKLSVTRKYTSVSTVMITNTGTQTGSIRRIAVKERSRSSILQDMPLDLQKAQLVSCNTAEDCFNALHKKQADAVIIGLPSATYLVNQRNSSAYVITPVSSVSLELCAAAVRSNHTLVSILNKGINSVAYTINGIIANNTVAQDSLKATISRIPAGAVAVFAAVMTLLVLLLLWALIALTKSRKTKIAAIQAEGEAREQRIKAESYEKSAEEKNAFFANISHDMRTPLNAIIGFIRMAKKPGLSDETRNDYLDKAGRSSALLLDLINDTLTMSKASSGKLQICPEPVDNRELLESIIVPIRETAIKKNVGFSADYSCTQDRTILADTLNVQKVFLNLLSNAVKYTPVGGHVSFRVYHDPAQSRTPDTVFVVSDDGIGISEEFLPHIFEPFSQEKQKGYEAVGTGLGLSIVRQLVDLMGGTIEVRSEKNHGSTFTVRLHFEEAAQTESSQPKTKKIADLTGRKVLLCEDNELNREIAVALLNEKGVTVIPAENGQIGVEKFTESVPGTFDAVLMDVRMPVMDGIEATSAIRALQRQDAKTIPIIAMTADAFDDDVRKCRDAGMSDHVAKPIDPAELYQVLSSSIYS